VKPNNLILSYGGCFLRIHFFFTNVPSSPHTSSHMSGHHPATVRLAGRKRHARFESSEALAELPAVARTAVELHGCCARVSLAAAPLSQHIDGVARAGSAGTKSGSSARSLVLLTMLAPVVENRTVEGSARARRRCELANRRRRCHRQPPSGWHLRRRFASFQRQRGPADPSNYVFCANTPCILGREQADNEIHTPCTCCACTCTRTCMYVYVHVHVRGMDKIR